MVMHRDEVAVSEEVVRQLLASQFPELADEPIRAVEANGTVNAIFRVGEDLAARFPLRRTNAGREREALELEARAGAELATVSPFPSPSPVAIGEPGAGHPLPWALQTWLPGEVAEDGAAADSTTFALDLATLVSGLRRAATGARTARKGRRGGDLRDHDAWVQTCLERSRHLLDVPVLAAIWAELVRLPRTAPDVMSHGDLIPGNVLVSDERLTGVLDCGGFAPADPALDLIAAWHLLDAESREVFRGALAPAQLDWERSRAWAFEQSIGAVWYYETSNPSMSAMGRRTLDRLVADVDGR